MKNKFDRLTQCLLETPDELITRDGRSFKFGDCRVNPVAFSIIQDNMVYGECPGAEIHGQMTSRLFYLLSEVLVGTVSLDQVPAKLKNYSIHAPTFNNLLELKKKGILLKPSVEGRFWKMDNGYISFWMVPTKVLPQLPVIEEFIVSLGYDPKKVLWEAPVTRFTPEDRMLYADSRRFKQFDYDTFIRQTNNSNKEAEAAANRLRQLHTIAGLKRAEGKIIPGEEKPAWWKNLTRQGG